MLNFEGGQHSTPMGDAHSSWEQNTNFCFKSTIQIFWSVFQNEEHLKVKQMQSILITTSSNHSTFFPHTTDRLHVLRPGGRGQRLHASGQDRVPRPDAGRREWTIPSCPYLSICAIPLFSSRSRMTPVLFQVLIYLVPGWKEREFWRMNLMPNHPSPGSNWLSSPTQIGQCAKNGVLTHLRELARRLLIDWETWFMWMDPSCFFYLPNLRDWVIWISPACFWPPALSDPPIGAPTRRGDCLGPRAAGAGARGHQHAVDPRPRHPAAVRPTPLSLPDATASKQRMDQRQTHLLHSTHKRQMFSALWEFRS